jgi:hypothetical protein
VCGVRFYQWDTPTPSTSLRAGSCKTLKDGPPRSYASFKKVGHPPLPVPARHLTTDPRTIAASQEHILFHWTRAGDASPESAKQKESLEHG